MTEKVTVTAKLNDVNPLEHITRDLAKGLHNYEAILNGLVTWSTTDNPNVTVRLATDAEPGFVDYTFPSRAAYSSQSSMFGSADTGMNMFDFENALAMAATPTDSTVLRFTRTGNKSSTWRLFENAVLYEDGPTATRNYAKGSYVRVKDADGEYTGTWYLMDAIATGEPFDLGDSAKVHPAVSLWKRTQVSQYQAVPGMMAYTQTTDGRILAGYILTGESTTRSPGDSDSGWEMIACGARAVPEGFTYRKGSLVVYNEKDDKTDASVYMYIGSDAVKPTGNSYILPYITVDGESVFDSENWYGPLVLVRTIDVDGTTVYNHTPTTDIRGYILQSRSSESVPISVMANVAVLEGSSEPHQGLGVFNTCNYSNWPTTTVPKWREGVTYRDDGGDPAIMTFHHADDSVKMCNIINYDGPDVDNGLAVYLPAMDKVAGDSGEPAYVEAQDGAMFEFMFRIWPSPEYSASSSPDLIINKAQVCVYSVPYSDNLGEGATMVARFSMARATNFYVWAENIAVPNRPVFYKARFVYSKTAKEWKTYDCYQIPDHVFVSPRGFIDPTVRGEETGIQTAGFPLMQDPFGGLDMSGVRMNRIEPN